MSQQHQLVGILFTDIVGYTSLMQENEQKTIALIKHYNTALNALVSLHGGKVLNYYGDGSLCTFASATEALNCAVELQKELQSDPKVPLRIGLHIGEIFYEDEKALGDGINIASRIQSLGQANTILFSKEVYDKIRNHPEFKAVSLGVFDFKNVDDPLEVFALSNEGLVVPVREQMTGKLKEKILRKKKLDRRNWIVGGIASALIIAVILFYLKFYRHQSISEGNSIAVLPFNNLSADPNEAFFADGMMDEVLNELYKIGGLKVISRTSSLRYRGSNKTTPEIARELGVANVLECSLQKDGNHIRIIAQLINGSSDDHVWAETYDRDLNDIFSIQSDIAQRIAAALKVKIDPALKERIESIPTKNIEAYNLYLRARNTVFDERRQFLLQAAIVLDSAFADAYAELANFWIFYGGYDGKATGQQVLDNAKPLLKKALQLNPDLPYVHLNLAYLNFMYIWDFETARKEYQISRELSPSNPDVTAQFVDYLLAMGNFKDALRNATEGFTLDSNINIKDLALANYFNGNLKSAMELISRMYYRDKLFGFAFVNYLRIGVYCGEYSKVISVFEEDKKNFEPDIPYLPLCYAAIAYHKSDLKDSATKYLQEIKTRGEKSPIGSPSFYIACIYTAMNENDQAIQWLQKGYRDHEVEMYWINVDPVLVPLHNDPRFKELTSKIGFK
jgi:TolB-like protein/class 3 adenylate cyclase